LRAFRPVWDKTPTHHHDLALASIAIEADDGLKGLRCYVPRRTEVRHGRTIDMEVLRDASLIGASDVAATHEDSLACECLNRISLTESELRGITQSVDPRDALVPTTLFPGGWSGTIS